LNYRLCRAESGKGALLFRGTEPCIKWHNPRKWQERGGKQADGEGWKRGGVAHAGGTRCHKSALGTAIFLGAPRLPLSLVLKRIWVHLGACAWSSWRCSAGPSHVAAKCTTQYALQGCSLAACACLLSSLGPRVKADGAILIGSHGTQISLTRLFFPPESRLSLNEGRQRRRAKACVWREKN
jgi:hypothetical protein